MNYLTNFFKLGCVAVLIALVGLPGAFAQTTRYVDPAGSGTAPCTDQANGCPLATALGAITADAGDVLSFRVRRVGGTVRIVDETVTIGDSLTFSAYLQSGGTGVRGTVEFTGTVTITDGAEDFIRRHANLTTKFKSVTVGGTTGLDPFDVDTKNQGSWEIEDYLQIGIVGTPVTTASIGKLIVANNLTIRGLPAAEDADGPILVASEVMVSSGKTLTVGTKGQSADVGDGSTPDNPLQLRVPLMKGDKDSSDNFTVAGTINGTGAIWIAYTGAERDADGFNLHQPSDYMPDDGNKVDHDDCTMIQGGGRIKNDIYAVAAGNICISVREIGGLIAVGSINADPADDDDNPATNSPLDSLTTDIIFRGSVTVDGSVQQWNDARVVFESSASIGGSVTLDQGSFPEAIWGADDIASSLFGQARVDASTPPAVVFVREDDAASCEYVRDDEANETRNRGMIFSGVQFERNATIEDDLVLKFGNTEDDERKPAGGAEAMVCASKVLFMAPPAGLGTGPGHITRTSTVEGNLDFQNDGEVLLHGDDSTRADKGGAKYYSLHNLQLDGDIYSEAGTGTGEISMGIPAMSKIAGECKGNDDISLGTGNSVTFTAGADHAVVANGDISISTLIIQDELSIEGSGSLQVTTLQVGSTGELVSDENVQVGGGDLGNGALILQGRGLDGTLHTDSRITKLSYGGRSTDTASLVDGGTLVLHAGTGEILFRNALTASTVGLCSGTIVLADPGDEDKKTLTVTGMLHVRDGTIRLDTNDPGSIGTDLATRGAAGDRYVLRYLTEGPRTATMEWFDPRDVVIAHKDAVITKEGDVSLAGKLHILSGKLHVTGDLTVGAAPFRFGIDRFLNIHAPGKDTENTVLHAASVTAHGPVTVDGTLVTDDGDLNLSGARLTTGAGADRAGTYRSGTATISIGAKGTVNLGMGGVDPGALVLGPGVTAKADGLHGDWPLPPDDATRPVASLEIRKSGDDQGTLMASRIYVPEGSKQTMLTGETFGTVVFDGTRTPNDRQTEAHQQNWDGTLYFLSQKVVIDSLSATQGSVEFTGNTDDAVATAEIKKDVALSSGRIYANNAGSYVDSLKFGGDLAISGTGGFSSREGTVVTVAGDFTLENDEMKGGVDMHGLAGGGAYLSGGTRATVMGDFMVSGTGVAERFGSEDSAQLILKGNFHFGLVAEDQDADDDYMLKADIEFSGKSQQSVQTSAIELDDVTIVNNEGVMLMSNVTQSKYAHLTLTKGAISTGEHAWIFKNLDIEDNLVLRTSAQEGDRCGPDGDAACDAAIWKGSRQSYVSGMLTRHLMEGNAGGGVVTGGYIFPVGGSDEDNSFFRPVILQLPVDLADAGAVTVSPMAGPSDNLLDNNNLLVQADGGSLTLDAHSDIFWKLDLAEELSSNLNIRVAAEGLSNVFDSERVRIVQWDCDWSNARLAGTYDLGGASSDPTFAVNDFVNGVLNVTQEGINVGSCSILGIASNGLENPIHLDPLTGGLTRVQFIHNLPLPVPVDLYLDDVKLMGGLGFQSATGYGYYAAGDHMISVAPVVPPGVPADTIRIPLSSLANEQSYAVIAHGALTDPKIKIVQTQLKSSVDNMVEAILVHGSGDLGDVDVRILDPADNMTPTKLLANNFSLDAATRYIVLEPGAHNVEVTSPDNREQIEVYYVDLNGYQGETLVLNLSGSKADLGLLGVDVGGGVFLSQVVTGVEGEAAEEIPTEFTLHGNYPNPFNPSTRIEFDLPEAAQVTLQVIDMLGREVMTLPSKEFEAGASRTLELNATNLASGTYLYRMIATGAESRYVKTGRMTLVK